MHKKIYICIIKKYIMPLAKFIDIKDLYLDLKNPRTVPQENEEKAIETMISIKPDRFNAVMESILDDGYLTTESIIVLNDGQYTVKEGNRRIAILKLIHGIYDKKNYAIPSNIQNRIDDLTPEWLAANRSIPCGVYSTDEADLVDKIVNLTHAKGEKASRDPWTSVAKARHNRDVKGGTELGLDLLEKYLKDGKNINQSQKERWSGDYPLTVLDEALRKVYERTEFASVSDLVNAYPKINHRLALEEILLDVGQERIGFKQIREKEVDFLLPYGLAPKVDTTKEETAPPDDDPTNKAGSTKGTPAPQQLNDKTPEGGTSGTPEAESPELPEIPTTPAPSQPEKPKSPQLGTPKYVKGVLRKFNTKGNRQKVVALKAEMCELNIQKTPMAFCFLLRSAFEISAKAYANDNGISIEKTNKKGDVQNKTLAELLREIVSHLTNNGKNKGMEKELHGALTEITKSEGILSVTSMNQLVHGTTFSIPASDICTIFGNIFPLLDAMN